MNRVQVKKNKYDMKIYNNKYIGMIIPTTTKGLNIKCFDDLYLIKFLIKSFLKWCTYKNYYHFHIGYDYNDSYYLEKEKDVYAKIFNTFIFSSFTIFIVRSRK